ncbi:MULTISPECIES: IucA/IucC family siderophore biosynthesis protein [unclassified Streptomyces]|uniref:IucA/IucC family protein n=1 Tax=Streptomyces sp. KL109B TaxID=3045155 RepID=UPI00278C3748|nr:MULTISPECIES: IucA/IucC family protein [unclassified Streptomyces]
MNATPASDGRPRPTAGGSCDTQAPHPQERDSIPRQKGGDQQTERPHTPTVDLLEHPDPATAAQAAAVENLLRCWVRENNIAPPSFGALRIPLPASGTALLVPVHYWSPSGWHRFGLPCLENAPHHAPRVDAVTLAALLSRESARGEAESTRGEAEPSRDEAEAESARGAAESARGEADAPVPTGSAPDVAPDLDHGPDATPVGDDGELVVRVADSMRRTIEFIADRRRRPTDAADPFLAAEQALVLGHPLHPTPKSREGLSEAEAGRYSPELRGSFPLHWISVAPDVLAQDSAWTDGGRARTAADLTSQLAGSNLPLPHGHAALPVHPWQLRELRQRPATAALLDAGLLRDLGPHGEPWFPTSSVRTLYQPGAPAMLKLSLGLRITNSRRENLRKELHRGVEAHRLLGTGLAEEWHAAHPGFDIVRDPAWLAVDDPDGAPVPGLDVMIRANPFRSHDDASCVAGFVSPRPTTAPADGAGRTHDRADDRADRADRADRTGHPAISSRLADTVTRLAARSGRPHGAVAAEWFLRYLEHVVRPVLWLDGEAGVALEAHQQNTVLLLDADGWPAGGRYRDNQGYYFRESRRAELDRRLPGIGTHSDTFVDDDVTDERFAYYLAINNVLGLIGAFGSQRLADEALLLAAFRRFLGEAAAGPTRLRSTLPSLLLDSPTLRCKANMLTRLHGLDELVGPVDTQSVYVTIANPFHSRRT